MRKLIAAVFLLSLVSAQVLATSELKAEAKSSNRWLKVSINAPWALFGAFLGYGEFKVTDKMSLKAYAGYIDTRLSINPDVNSFTVGSDGLVGLGFGFGARWYLLGGCMEGLYVEDYVDLKIGLSRSGNPIPLGPAGEIAAVNFALGNRFHFGYSWVSDIGFFVDAAAGVQISAPISGFPSALTHGAYLSDGNSLTYLDLALALGWAF